MDAFDDTPLKEFVKDMEVVSLNDHFFLKDNVPYLAVFIACSLGTVALQGQAKGNGPAAKAANGRGQWREHLAGE